MEQVVLFGLGVNAALAYAALAHHPAYRVAAFTVDRAYLTQDTLFDLPVVAFEEVEQRFPPSAYRMWVSISYTGVNRLRAEKYRQAKDKGYRLLSYISPRAEVPAGLVLGDNVCIAANCTIGPFTEIGSNVWIAAGCTIGHHTVIDDDCYLSAGVVVSGKVRVGRGSLLGAGAVLRDRITIGPECVIGAGAVILEDTPERGVYRAHPAQRLPITSDKIQIG